MRVILIMLIALAASADEGVITLRSTVKGNQEQPKVMYVLPWQSAERIEVEYRPDNEWLGEVFAPVDRDEFIRELNYRDAGFGASTAEAEK
ncbi:cell division protein FtsY [Oceanicoccus sp. KOV_DT_Chl]|uniref:cell division protein FtsY n=1 Tax=Oceanicoccus sp. KOV_DT_Chl TaxID=1904639 RepID=UPI000C7A5A37|nr:cell division protein FtsY [Oceanicoccus sp. KOV_DT_Chl]